MRCARLNTVSPKAVTSQYLHRLHPRNRHAVGDADIGFKKHGTRDTVGAVSLCKDYRPCKHVDMCTDMRIDMCTLNEHGLVMRTCAHSHV